MRPARRLRSRRVKSGTGPCRLMDDGAISFGPFRLLAAQRLLLEGDKPVRLGSRAFDILATLLERPGEPIGKDELISRTWPKTFVEDANLKIQISALRRALGDGQGGRRYIATIPGRGYNFVAPVRFEKPADASLAATIASAAAHNLPLAMTRMIGREEVVATLVSRLSRERVLTRARRHRQDHGRPRRRRAYDRRLRTRRLADRSVPARRSAPGAERGCDGARPGSPHRKSASRAGRWP